MNKKVYDPDGNYEIKGDQLNLTFKVYLPQSAQKYKIKPKNAIFDISSNNVNALLVAIEVKDKNNRIITTNLRNENAKLDNIEHKLKIKISKLAQSQLCSSGKFDVTRRLLRLVIIHDHKFSGNSSEIPIDCICKAIKLKGDDIRLDIYTYVNECLMGFVADPQSTGSSILIGK